MGIQRNSHMSIVPISYIFPEQMMSHAERATSFVLYLVPETGLEPAHPLTGTTTSTLRVCHFTTPALR